GAGCVSGGAAGSPGGSAGTAGSGGFGSDTGGGGGAGYYGGGGGGGTFPSSGSGGGAGSSFVSDAGSNVSTIGNGSADPSVTIEPLTAPGAPSGVVAKAGNKQATIKWTAPANIGGYPLIDYTVTSHPS